MTTGQSRKAFEAWAWSARLTSPEYRLVEKTAFDAGWQAAQAVGRQGSEWKRAVKFCEEHLRKPDEDGCSCELHAILERGRENELEARLTTLLTGLRGLREEWKESHQTLLKKAKDEDYSGMDSSRIHAKAQLFYGHAAALDTLVRTVEGE